MKHLFHESYHHLLDLPQSILINGWSRCQKLGPDTLLLPGNEMVIDILTKNRDRYLLKKTKTIKKIKKLVPLIATTVVDSPVVLTSVVADSVADSVLTNASVVAVTEITADSDIKADTDIECDDNVWGDDVQFAKPELKRCDGVTTLVNTVQPNVSTSKVTVKPNKFRWFS